MDRILVEDRSSAEEARVNSVVAVGDYLDEDLKFFQAGFFFLFFIGEDAEDLLGRLDKFSEAMVGDRHSEYLEWDYL